jgi:hypothetical protein
MGNTRKDDDMRMNSGEIWRGLNASVSTSGFHEHGDEPDSLRTKNFLVRYITISLSRKSLYPRFSLWVWRTTYFYSESRTDCMYTYCSPNVTQDVCAYLQDSFTLNNRTQLTAFLTHNSQILSAGIPVTKTQDRDTIVLGSLHSNVSVSEAVQCKTSKNQSTAWLIM